MSFSSDCKEELCRVPCDKPCCRAAELAALYMTLGSLSLLGARAAVRAVCHGKPGCGPAGFCVAAKGNADRCPAALRNPRAFWRPPQVCADPSGPPAGACRCSPGWGIMETGPDGQPAFHTGARPRVRLSRDCCRRAFLRGALLGCGTITNPELGYHLELTARDEALRLAIAKCLQSLGVPVKQTQRRTGTGLYVKQSRPHRHHPDRRRRAPGRDHAGKPCA